MTVIATSAEVKFRSDGKTEMRPDIRLDGNSQIYCFTYDDSAPVLVLVAGNVRVSLSVPDPHQVTADDVRNAQGLAAVVTRYAAELERGAAADLEALEEASV